MESLKFNITNNAWINNGLVRLNYEFKKNYPNDISIKKENNSIEFTSNNENGIEYYINNIIKLLATEGTYNYAQVFKLINKYTETKLSPPSPYPKDAKSLKNKEKISKEIRAEIKKYDKRTFNSSEQIWKMRMSFLGKSDNYFKLGLNFNSSDIYKKLIENDAQSNVCPNCGQLSKKMIDTKQFQNPLLNEHHNNQIEGIGNIRKKVQLCPSCMTLSIVSLFDKFIPFYVNDNNNAVLSLPNCYDLNILEKICNNLSLNSQYIDLSDSDVTNYNTNITNLINTSSQSAVLLSLLNNILNKFSKDVPDDIFEIFTSNETIELVDWIFITKDQYKINRIKANEKVYKILQVQKDPNNENDIYLVNDFFRKINFNNFSPYMIEKFFNGFLNLDYEKIAQSLFEMVKLDITFYKNSNYPIYLFKRVFLNQIMGEILMLDKDFKNSCETIANTIGEAFYKDIGLMSKFAYSTDVKVFKENLEEACFLMAKRSALDSNENFYLNRNDLETLFDNLNNDNFNETKSYFVSFMSCGAIYKKYRTNMESE